MLAVSSLGFRYGKTVILQDVSFAMAPGEIVCLVGPNGAGKTTLLKCINRILHPGAGDITLDGKKAELLSRRELARCVAYVPQHAGSGMSLTVFDMVRLGRAPHRGLTTSAQDRAIVWSAIEKLDLESLALRSFGTLSGGQRQRVLIARALAQEGQLILMDEPTSSLDPFYQLETISTIRALSRERNIASLVVMHDLSLAARLCDVMILMDRGKIRAKGGWRDVLTSDLLAETFKIAVIVGSDGGVPYLIPRLNLPG